MLQTAFSFTGICLALVVSQVFAIEKDRSPAQPVNFSGATFPSPVFEPLSPSGNKSPYTVLGRVYKIISKPEKYRAKGIASWYGEKFHGRPTSNGEIYDMYSFTAAHRTLPLPTWIKVTNLENGLWLYVRVNDRGPFHSGRIVDLSYAVASYLDMLANGTARVLLEYAGIDEAHGASTLEQVGLSSKENSKDDLFILQVAAFGEIFRANRLVETLRALKVAPIKVHPITLADNKKMFRVQIGPSSIDEVKRARVIIAGAVDDIGFPFIEQAKPD